MGWEAAYEEKIGLWRFWNSQSGKTFGRYWAESMMRRLKDGEGIEQRSYLTRIPEIEGFKAMLAKPIWVEEEMVDVWEAAAKEFQPEPLFEQDLVEPYGFVFLPRPMYTVDARGRRMSYRAISWGIAADLPSGDVMNPGVISSEEAEELGRKSYGVNLSIYAHRNDPDDYTHGGGAGEHPLQLAHITPWAFNKTFDEQKPALGDFEGYEAESVETAWTGLWTEIQALFRLMQQRISSHSEETPPRATRRRAKAAGLDETPVRVVTLRRPTRKENEGEGEGIEWKHRWIVDGHWRNQWYPSIHDHRQIWISPYVKGPEDKDLRVKPVKAYKLVR